MTPVALLAAFAARDVRLTVVGDRLHVDAPTGELTAADREMLSASKAALVGLLHPDETVAGSDDEITFHIPDGPCQLCGTPLVWVEHWPTRCDHCWLCLTCAACPVPTLVEIADRLTPDERGRLDAEAAGGDDLARAVLNELEGTARGGRS